MRAYLVLALLVFSQFAFAQSTDGFEYFKSADYSRSKYTVSVDTTRLHTVSIELIRVRKTNINASYTDSLDFSCRAWVTIKRRSTIVKQYYFKSIEALGGCMGVFFPATQPRNDFFVFSKFGDYNGRIFIVDTSGKVIDRVGGSFQVSSDKRYLFSNFDSDAPGLTVYDFGKHKLLYSSQEDVPSNLSDWYYQDGKFIATTFDDDTDHDTITVVNYDITNNNLTKATVVKSYLRENNKLTQYNHLDYPECNCGDTN